MDFFKNKTVRLIAAIVLCVSAAILTLGGISPESITDLITKALAVVSAIEVLISAILHWIEPEKE